MKYLYFIMPLIIAFLLDFIIGDPYKLPHPVRLIGKCIGAVEKITRRVFSSEKTAGAVMAMIITTLSFIVPFCLLFLAYKINLFVGIAVESVLGYYLLAARCLEKESIKVYGALQKRDIEEARKAVSMIVGRDTQNLDEKGIIKAAVETVAENSSDGVTAPLFYMTFGVPLGYLYKAVNTMDSMVGYKNEQYINFGKIPAKIDDIFNFIPSRFTALLMIVSSFILGLDGKNAYRMQEDILFCKERGNANSTFNELVVMSPFLSESVIADFNLTDRALSDCKRTLITRRSELGKLKASDVDNFTIYALKDEIIDGEDEISDELADKKKQDIHAKIYLRRKYSDVDLYLGSMNASYSAINKNVEMMLWLGTKNMYLNGNKFLEDIFCGPAGDVKNPFEEVTVADAVLETESDNRDLLEQKIKELCRVKRQAVIQKDSENAGKYKIAVAFSGIESDSTITVSPFNSRQEQTLSEHIEFSELEILQLSEFYEITVRSGDDTIRRIIMIPTSGFPDDRESAAVNSVVKDRTSFVEYIAFALGDDYVASMLEGKQMGESGFFANSSDAMPALYEKMLKTSVEEPERIKDIGYVLKMVTDKDIIPDEFRELYETFCNTLKIRR